MNKSLILAALLSLGQFSFAQEDKELYNNYEPEEEEVDFGNEIGFDFQFNASTLGGIAGGGLKLGFQQKKDLIYGPSVRLQRTWYNNQGIKGNYSVYGGGAFIHYRLFDYLFVGAEFELLSNPINYINPYGGRQWVLTGLLGGGFSHSFNNSFRLNAGIMYDVLDQPNSPFRQGYVLKKENGALIPVLYRIAIFLPI